MKRAERDAADLARRLEVLSLPVVAMRTLAYLRDPFAAVDDIARTCIAVGTGPGGTAAAVWCRRDSGVPQSGVRPAAVSVA